MAAAATMMVWAMAAAATQMLVSTPNRSTRLVSTPNRSTIAHLQGWPGGGLGRGARVAQSDGSGGEHLSRGSRTIRPEVRKLVMTDGVLLQPEQEELLKALVEASRNVPRDEREEFHLLTDGDGTSVMHPGLPGRQMRVHQGDVDILEADGLLLVTQIGRWHRSFVVTPLGFSLYEELQHRSGAPTQQVEETLTRYLDSDAFQRSYPEAHRKWADAAERLSRSDSQQQWTMIGHLCREAMQAFATELVEQHKPPAVTPDKAKDVARIRAVLDQRKSMLRTTVVMFEIDRALS